MKKILFALAIAGFAFSNAQGQTKMICRKGSGNSTSCYKTKYAQNFPVCKDGNGYHICGEPRTSKNSTSAHLPGAMVNDFDNTPSYETSQNWAGYRAQQQPMPDMTPKSQSYSDYQENATVPYGQRYDQEKGRVAVCYGGDNVGALNRNPYNGCPSPQYDGPERNKERAWSNGN